MLQYNIIMLNIQIISNSELYPMALHKVRLESLFLLYSIAY